MTMKKPAVTPQTKTRLRNKLKHLTPDIPVRFFGIDILRHRASGEKVYKQITLTDEEGNYIRRIEFPSFAAFPEACIYKKTVFVKDSETSRQVIYRRAKGWLEV
jgi:hypothetical protein